MYVSMNMRQELNISSGGTDPGFMFLSVEYVFGLCLSRMHHRHAVCLLSGVLAQAFKLGKRSRYVTHF